MISPVHALSYTGYIVAEVISGAVTVARDVLTPGLDVSPAIVELPLHCETDLEVALMASSITITPGTVTLGISPAVDDRPPTLFVHALYGHDAAELVEGLRDMEHRLLRMTRGRTRAAEAMEVPL